MCNNNLNLIKKLKCHIHYTNVSVLHLPLLSTRRFAKQSPWPNLCRGATRFFNTSLNTPISRITVRTITVSGCALVFVRVGYVSMYVYMHPVVNVVITNKGVTLPDAIIFLIWYLETEEERREWMEKSY